jgi:hypothetical protein
MTDTQIEVDEHAKARLVLQTDASNARASWLANVRSATTDEATKAYIDKMKFSDEFVSSDKIMNRIRRIARKLADSDSTEEEKEKDILTKRMAITSFIMHEPM